MAKDEYTCTLDEKYIKKAKDELNEIPSDRLSAIEALKDWIIKQPHLTFDLGSFIKHVFIYI